jgi:phosphonate transport system substrate-binding protein
MRNLGERICFWMRWGGGIFLLVASVCAWAEQSEPALRIGLPHALVDRQYSLMVDWRQYLQNKLHRQVEFVVRRNEGDTLDQLRLERLDFAWISDYSYVRLKPQANLLAVPLYKGRPYFRSYLITGSHPNSLLQLKGAIFAYADPYSNTGYLAPRYELWKAERDPNKFFRKTFFTWSHRGVVEAVAQGLATAGAVDGFIWDSLEKTQPDLTRFTRIIAHSQEFGAPPFVANRSVSKESFSAMQRALIEMTQDSEGQMLLKRINLDGFAVGADSLYDRVTQMMQVLGAQ